jgi:hypothetical protein
MAGATRPGPGQIAVLRRFPTQGRQIEELTASSEDFRDMCDELAEAELALLASEDLPPDLRSERKAEWTALIDRLNAEIASALTNFNVIYLERMKHPRSDP